MPVQVGRERGSSSAGSVVAWCVSGGCVWGYPSTMGSVLGCLGACGVGTVWGGGDTECRPLYLFWVVHLFSTFSLEFYLRGVIWREGGGKGPTSCGLCLFRDREKSG